MTDRDHEFKHESLESPVSLVDYLSALMDGFSKGNLTFRDKNGEITLKPRGLVKFQLRATKRGSRYKLNIELSWRDGERDATDGALQIEA